MRAAVVAGIVALAVATAVWRASPGRGERFLPLIPLLGLGLTAAGITAGVTGADKKIEERVWKTEAGKKLDEKISGGAGATYVPQFKGRVWDGADWSCPGGTVETGTADDAKAYMAGQWAPPVWKAGPGGKWDWLCPVGTVPTKDSQWEKKCEVGWTNRVLQNGKWSCPEGTQDSGKGWDNADWHEAQKQCKMTRAYTVRVLGSDGKWACPAGTKDTGRGWTSPSNGADQCKWTGP